MAPGTNVTFSNDGTFLTISASGSGGGTIVPSYVTVNSEPALPNDRRLNNGNGITLVDNGAASTIDVGLATPVAVPNGGTGLTDSGTDNTQALMSDGSHGFVMATPTGGLPENPLSAVHGGTGLDTSGIDNTQFLKSDGAGGFVMGSGGGLPETPLSQEHGGTNATNIVGVDGIDAYVIDSVLTISGSSIPGSLLLQNIGGALDLTTQTTNSGDVNLFSHKLINVADPTNPQDVATDNWVTTNFLSQSDAGSTYLPLAGGTMSGDIDMNTNNLMDGGLGQFGHVNTFDETSTFEGITLGHNSGNARVMFGDGDSDLNWEIDGPDGSDRTPLRFYMPNGGGIKALLFADGQFQAVNGFDANDEKIINVAPPLADSDAANKDYVDTAIAGLPACLPLAGGTMGGTIDMNINAIVNLVDPTNAQDPVTLNYLGSYHDSSKLNLAGGTMSGTIDMATHTLINLPDPTNPQDPVTLSYTDNRYIHTLPQLTYQEHGGDMVLPTSHAVWSVSPDSYDRVWYGTNLAFIGVINKDGSSPLEYSTTSAVHQVASDSTVTWYSTNSPIIGKINHDGTGNAEFSTPSNTTGVIIGSDSRTWYSTGTTKIGAINADGSGVIEYDTISNVTSVVQGPSGTIWYGTGTNIIGTINLDGTGNIEYATISNVTRVFNNPADGYMWYATGTNIIGYIHANGSSNTEYPTTYPVTALCHNNDGRICYGTDAGYIGFITSGGIYTDYGTVFAVGIVCSLTYPNPKIFYATNGSPKIGVFNPAIPAASGGTGLLDSGTDMSKALLCDGSHGFVMAPILPLSGGTLGGQLNMGSNALTNLIDPTNPQDAMTLAYSNNHYLLKAGGTMSGVLDLGNNAINNLPDPASAQDPVTLNYLSVNYLPLVGGTMTGAIDMQNHKINGLSNPSSNGDAMTLGYSNSNYLQLAGGTMSGSIDMGNNVITNLVDPSNPQDAATQNYIISNIFGGTSNLSSGTTTITDSRIHSGTIIVVTERTDTPILEQFGVVATEGSADIYSSNVISTSAINWIATNLS